MITGLANGERDCVVKQFITNYTYVKLAIMSGSEAWCSKECDVDISQRT